MPRVVIVEDEHALLESLARGLREEGYEVAAAGTVTEAMTILGRGSVDALVLDLMLPDRDGLTFLRQLRGSGFSQPVLIVTARDSIEDRIAGLDSGADDYLVKPFSFNELLARLRAVLRRTSSSRDTVLRVQDIELDLLNRVVTRAGKSVDLTQRQFELLAYLMRYRNETVTKEMIARDVWKETTATWTNVIEVQINHLRRKIERPPLPPILHTIRGEGYLLGRTAMNGLNVRWRLTIWYGAVLTFVVVGFAACLYWMMDRHLLARTDFELDEELNELALEVRLARSETELQKNLQARFYRHSSFDFQVTPLKGKLLFQSERLKRAILPAPDLGLLEHASQVVSKTQNLDGLGETRIASRLTSESSGSFLVQASTPLLPNRQELRALLAMLLAAGPVAIAGALVGGYFLARQSLAPVERMATTAQQITANRLNERIEVANPNDELGHLALTLNAMIERLRGSFEEMRRFTADAAHELRTPLAVLQTEAEVALRSPRSAEEYRRVVQATLDESRRLTRLADQLLALCRHDSGLQPAKFEEVPLSALLADVADQLQLAAKEKGIAVELGPLGDWVVDGDDIQLSQLLFNLLDNAIKFTPPGGQVKITGECEDNCVSLVIADSGMGISSDDLSHVFERFYRADKSRNGKTGGTGLGLAICKAIIDAHHGTIRIESSAGHGTSVHLRLPVELTVPSLVPA